MNIESDVQQLKNRVRMLLEEQSRALRQIGVTRTKTAKVRFMMDQNDHEFKVEVLRLQEVKGDEAKLR